MELNLDIGYSHHVLYENMHLILPNEGVISLIGNNGSGKSTIFKTIMGLIPPLRGTVPESLISRCAIVSDYVHMPEDNKVKDVLSLCTNRANYERYYEKLYAFISKQLYQKVRHLSSGQKRILEIFMVLLSGKNIIILDEATNALDIKNKELFLNYVRDLSQNGILFIHTSHDLSEILALESTCYLLQKDEGRVKKIQENEKTLENIILMLKQENLSYV